MKTIRRGLVVRPYFLPKPVPPSRPIPNLREQTRQARGEVGGLGRERGKHTKGHLQLKGLQRRGVYGFGLLCFNLWQTSLPQDQLQPQTSAVATPNCTRPLCCCSATLLRLTSKPTCPCFFERPCRAPRTLYDSTRMRSAATTLLRRSAPGPGDSPGSALWASRVFEWIAG